MVLLFEIDNININFIIVVYIIFSGDLIKNDYADLFVSFAQDFRDHFCGKYFET